MLSGTLEILESWDAWDDIAALAHHQQVRTDLLEFIDDMQQTRDDYPNVRFLKSSLRGVLIHLLKGGSNGNPESSTRNRC